ncbi:hypothetical protein ONZ51_g762 [Trametes cubensis]|uniref:Terpene synthase n=1 Tax=Trametes cubensis TaxID=1111947 RepID=A0AAD7XG49_9APHY|nr:hypothetical protein ONZ51_g762 [Trametes cubensis]
MDSQRTTLLTLPDLHAITPFVGSFNPHYAKVALESSAWVDDSRALSDKKRAFFFQTGHELLCAHAYPYADEERYRVTCDFINLLFVFDETSDDQTGEGVSRTGSVFYNALTKPEYDDGTPLCKSTKEFRQRLLKHCRPLTYQRRFAASIAASPPAFALIGYALGIDLPDDILEYPAMMAMYSASADMVCWSNDLYSYNIEQAMGHTGNNIITVLMTHKGLGLQEAANYIGEHWKTLIKTYLDAKKSLPNWGVKIDHEVVQYTMALESWVIGNLNWSFESLRYFGSTRHEVRRTLVVRLHLRQIEEGDETDV